MSLQAMCPGVLCAFDRSALNRPTGLSERASRAEDGCLNEFEHDLVGEAPRCAGAVSTILNDVSRESKGVERLQREVELGAIPCARQRLIPPFYAVSGARHRWILPSNDPRSLCIPVSLRF